MAGRRKLSPRAERRALARAADKLGHAREKLAKLEAGGAPERPIDVVSASQVEPIALSAQCLRCEAPVRVEEHAAETIEGRRLRVVCVICPQCAAQRTLYFRIVGGELN